MENIRSNQISKPGWIRVPAKCHKCGGQGGSTAWAYTGWTCYQCRGSGAQPNGERVYAYPTSWTDQQVADHAELRESKAQARRDAKTAKEAAEQVAWLANQTPEFQQLVQDRDQFDGFIYDVLQQATYKPLSERQIEAVGEAVARLADDQAKAAEAAEKAQPLPTGKVTIKGEVVHFKSQKTYFGGGYTLKMIVKGEGWKVYGTVPSSLDCEVGDVVRFNATVEASDDDPTFGFFKRPTKAEIIKVAETDRSRHGS